MAVLAVYNAPIAERQERFKEFLNSSADLPPQEKAAAWLSFVAAHSESYGDLEALVFLASRGVDVRDEVALVREAWKCAEKEIFDDYNLERSSPIAVDDIATTTDLLNFWSGTREQQFTIDATMLRAIEWCRIGGFDPWRECLLREINEFVHAGCFSDIAGAHWLFAMCRSDYAV